jgi:hypothetical protein
VLAIAASHASGNVPRVPRRKPVVPPGNDEARSQPLEIPLPRCRQRLVEVVDVKNDPPLRRSEPAEVHQMAIAARLHVDAGRRRVRKIRRHDGRGAAVERERRLHHPPVSERQKLRHPPPGRRHEQIDRIAPASRRLPRSL